MKKAAQIDLRIIARINRLTSGESTFVDTRLIEAKPRYEHRGRVQWHEAAQDRLRRELRKRPALSGHFTVYRVSWETVGVKRLTKSVNE